MKARTWILGAVVAAAVVVHLLVLQVGLSAMSLGALAVVVVVLVWHRPLIGAVLRARARRAESRGGPKA